MASEVDKCMKKQYITNCAISELSVLQKFPDGCGRRSGETVRNSN